MIARRREPSWHGVAKLIDDAPIGWLLGIGAASMIAGLAYFGTETGGKPGEKYLPPVYRDGKIVPGQRE